MKDQINHSLFFTIAHDNMFHPEKESELARHNQLETRFAALVAKANLPETPRLGISDYKVPLAMWMQETEHGKKGVAIDRAALQLLTPEELDSVLAHELAHLKLNHKPGTYSRDEYAADEWAIKTEKNPEALAKGLAKIEQFFTELRKASPSFRITEGALRAFSGALNGIVGEGGGYHPPLYSRRNRMQKFAEQLDAERQPAKPSRY